MIPFDIVFNIIILLLFLVNCGMVLVMEQGKDLSLGLKRGFIAVGMILLFFVIGFRSINVGADTSIYMKAAEKPELFYLYKSEIGFYFLLKLVHAIGYAPLVVIIVALLFMVNMLNFIFKASPRQNILLLFLVVWTFFFTKSLAINVVRQGLAFSFLLVAYRYYEHKKYFQVVLNCILAVCFHKSAVILVLLFGVAAVLPVYLCLLLYAVMILLSASGFGILDIAGNFSNMLDSETAQFYLKMTTKLYKTGFRPQFVAFNSIYLCIFLYAYLKIKNTREQFPDYKKALNTYMLGSCVFFLMFQLPFSDRWGILSWMLIPLLLEPFMQAKTKYSIVWACVVMVFQLVVYVFFSILMAA